MYRFGTFELISVTRAIATASPWKAAKRFARDTAGSMLLFGLYVFLIMLMIAGVALDTIRFESERVMSQNTMDRALLAAADVDQKMDAVALVADYFNKAGLDGSKVVTTAMNEDGYKKVKATTTTVMPTLIWGNRLLFAKDAVPTLSAPAFGTATEGYGHVEISLVLDVSGSMAWYPENTSRAPVGSRRIDALKTAGNAFFDTVFPAVPSDKAGKVSVTIVPYSMQVNLGASLGARFNLSKEHTQSSCVDFPTSAFSSMVVTTTEPLSRTAHADLRSGSGTKSPAPGNRECISDPKYDVLAFSADKAELKAKLAQFEPQSDTAIDIGTKWGAAFLDPATKPVLDGMITSNAGLNTPAAVAQRELSGRPYTYASGKSMKVLVLMTDGENTNSYEMGSAYKSGNSPVVQGKDNKIYYYYKDRPSTTYDYYYNDNDKNTSDWYRLSDISSGVTIPLTYQALWNLYTVNYYDKNLYSPGEGGSTSNTWFANNNTVHTSYGGKDVRQLSVCNAAKANGIRIYTIALGKDGADMATAPYSSWSILQKCASVPAMYYHAATAAELTAAFKQIAGTVSELRLTQ